MGKLVFTWSKENQFFFKLFLHFLASNKPKGDIPLGKDLKMYEYLKQFYSSKITPP